MNKLEYQRSYLPTLKKEGGLPALLDEINFWGAKTLPQDYQRPVNVQSLRPEEEAFLTIDELGSIEVRNYETLTIKRCFSIGDYVGIFVEKCCIYVLKISIQRTVPPWTNGRLHLSVYSSEGELEESYNSEVLDFIQLFEKKTVRMVVDGDELFISTPHCFHFKVEKETQKIKQKGKWNNLQLLGKANEIYFLRNHRELVKFDDKIGIHPIHTFEDTDIRFIDKKDAGLYFCRIEGNNRAFWYFDTVQQTMHDINEELQGILDKSDYRKKHKTGNNIQSTKRTIHTRFLYDNDIYEVYYISESSNIFHSWKGNQLYWLRNRSILDLSQSLKTKDVITLFFDNPQILLFTNKSVERIAISENSYDKPICLQIPTKKENHDIYSKLIAITSEYIIRSPEHKKTGFTFIAIGDSAPSFTIDNQFVDLLASFNSGDVLFSNNQVIREDRRKESLLKWNQNKEATETCELKFSEEELIEDSIFIIDRKCIHPNDSNLLFWCISKNIILWDVESKAWRQIISYSDHEDETGISSVSIKDYNNRYILFQRFHSSGHLSIKLFSIHDNAFYKFDLKDEAIDSWEYAYKGICLCSDKVVAFASILKNTIEIIDLESGISRQIPYDQIDMSNLENNIELRYFAKTNILQVYDYETISFYSLYDLKLVAKLRIFRDDTFLFTSYKDTRYFYSKNPYETLRVINRLYRNEVLKDEELETYISEFNSWDHFDKLLFKGEEISDPGAKGLPEREPPKPLPEKNQE